MPEGTGNVRGFHLRCTVGDHELVAWYAQQLGYKAGPLLRIMPFNAAVKAAAKLKQTLERSEQPAARTHALAKETKRLAEWMERVA